MSKSLQMHSVEDYWPRRLLFVERGKLTSVERTGEATYGDFVSPAYNILSYTWGRYALDSGESIEIHNIPWKVPRIDSRHFTANQFLQVIEEISQEHPHIWIDVACIDQEDDEIKLDEIGHQAGIFDRAENAYIWLSRSCLDDLRFTIGLERPPLSEFIAKRDSTEWLEPKLRVVQNIVSDRWFSSLWTLQEAILRPDALLIPRSGEVNPELGFDTLVTRLGELYKAMVEIMEHQAELRKYGSMQTKGVQETTAEKLTNLLDDSGFMAMSAGIRKGILAYKASSFRTTLNPLDRVYGIMQVFGLVLGGAADPGGVFTPDELEFELGTRLLEQHPVYMQLFVHSKGHRPDQRSWCVRPDIIVPSRAGHVFFPAPTCQFDIDRQTWLANFSGKVCDFKSLSDFWWESSAHESRGHMSQTAEATYLDHTVRNQNAVPQNMLQGGSYQGGPGELNDILVREYGPDLKVLLLGKLQDIHRGRRDSYCWAGLLIFPAMASNMDGNISNWVRVGFCIWEITAEELEQEQVRLFRPCRLALQ